MFENNDEQYLLKRLGDNDVVLFLGAGFSADATSRLGTPLPLARDLGRSLWELVYSEPYEDGSSLADLYDAVLRAGTPHERIRALLEERLLTSAIPSSYDALPRPYWYRIYTTNIDDVLRRVYNRVGEPQLDVVAFPREELKERDASLDRIQGIFLHGQLPCRPSEITFSTGQFASRALRHSPLYDQFVGDYSTHCTVFLGTELNEPLFWQHVAAREERAQGVSEQRPRSFLIAPRIPAPRRTQLQAFNVVPVEAYTADFLQWLAQVAPSLPSRADVLRKTLPSVVALFESTRTPVTSDPDLSGFGKAFQIVPATMAVRSDRSFYLLGATPRWEDIYRGLDAPRDITDSAMAFVARVHARESDTRVAAILGSAGSGKSTVLRRLAVRLAQEGQSVFLTNSEELPNAATIRSALHRLSRPTTLLFDNAEVALGALGPIVEATTDLEFPPCIVFATRTNEFDRRSARLERITRVESLEMPHLSRSEIEGIIKVLDANSLLGRLQGLTPANRIREFEDTASRQLLVAMREATSGEGFDAIIKDEYDRLPSAEARQLYLCVALATDAGYRLSVQQLVGCGRLTPADTLHILERNLQGIVIRTGTRKDLLLLRHRLIAEHMVSRAAAREALADSYERLLCVLARDIPGAVSASRTFGLYRELVNHDTIFARFSRNLPEARSIYDSIAGALSGNGHFWLQYGLLELNFGNIQLAENYLRQAESIHPLSSYIQNAIGQLLLRKALDAPSHVQAVALLDEGTEVLRRQIAASDSPYPYHILCSSRLTWARKWMGDTAQLTEELKQLRELVREGRRKYTRNLKLKQLEGEIDREYLLQAVGPSVAGGAD